MGVGAQVRIYCQDCLQRLLLTGPQPELLLLLPPLVGLPFPCRIRCGASCSWRCCHGPTSESDVLAIWATLYTEPSPLTCSHALSIETKCVAWQISRGLLLPGGQTNPVTPRVCYGGGNSGASLTFSPPGGGGGRGGALVPVLLLPAVNTGWGGSPPIHSPLHQEGWKRGGELGLAGCLERAGGRSAPDECWVLTGVKD